MDIQSFLSYKELYKDFPKELTSFVDKVKIIRLKSKKTWKKQAPVSWIVKKKLNNDESSKVLSQFTEILNKIGDSNFDEISEKLYQLELTNKDQIKQLVNMILTKAMREDKYNTVYVKLCKKLFNTYIKDNSDNKCCFRNILLASCQSLFTELSQLSSDEDIKKSSLKNKKFMIGFIKFISEMYNQNMLTDSIMYNCVIKLVNKTKKNDINSIDCLCSMYNCIKINFSKQLPKNSETVLNYLKELSKDKSIRAKDRFTIMDTLGI